MLEIKNKVLPLRFFFFTLSFYLARVVNTRIFAGIELELIHCMKMCACALFGLVLFVFLFHSVFISLSPVAKRYAHEFRCKKPLCQNAMLYCQYTHIEKKRKKHEGMSAIFLALIFKCHSIRCTNCELWQYLHLHMCHFNYNENIGMGWWKWKRANVQMNVASKKKTFNPSFSATQFPDSV